MNFENEAAKYPSIILNDRQVCDLEMLMIGGYHPLKGYMTQKQYKNCLKDMYIDKKVLFPIPITLSINLKTKDELRHSNFVTLKHNTGLPLCILKIEDIYEYNVEKEANSCIGCYDLNHPYIKILQEEYNSGYTFNIGGEIKHFKEVPHYDFLDYRKTPNETKEIFRKKGWKNIIGFQTRNPMHRSHYELTKYALSQVYESNLLISPCVGITQSCDIDYYTRVKCYIKLMNYYDAENVQLNLLNFPMRMYGPRSALFHAIIRKNYGCTHFVVGRDHAGPSYKKENGDDFFEPYAAQELLQEYADVIGIIPIVSKMIVYTESIVGEDCKYQIIDNVDKKKYSILKLSGTQQRKILQEGKELPDWFTFPLVKQELQENFLPLHKQGFCVYFYGLSGSGKSYISNYLKIKLQEITNRKITLLDGDIIRTHISKGLGFSKEDRSINVQRIGYIASEIVKHNGICIVSNIAPYADDRKFNKNLISSVGNYIEVLVNTPLEVCEERDCKGLYHLARKGVLTEFTGISDPFEKYSHEDIELDGSDTIDNNLELLISYLKNKCLILDN